MAKKKRAAKKTYLDYGDDANLPQRKTKEIADTHSKQEIDVPQQRVAMEGLGENEQGKELFDFVLKGMIKPDKK